MALQNIFDRNANPQKTLVDDYKKANPAPVVNPVHRAIAEVQQTIAQGKGEKWRNRTINTAYGPVSFMYPGELTGHVINVKRSEAEAAAAAAGYTPSHAVPADVGEVGAPAVMPSDADLYWQSAKNTYGGAIGAYTPQIRALAANIKPYEDAFADTDPNRIAREQRYRDQNFPAEQGFNPLEGMAQYVTHPLSSTLGDVANINDPNVGPVQTALSGLNLFGMVEGGLHLPENGGKFFNPEIRSFGQNAFDKAPPVAGPGYDPAANIFDLPKDEPTAPDFTNGQTQTIPPVQVAEASQAPIETDVSPQVENQGGQVSTSAGQTGPVEPNTVGVNPLDSSSQVQPNVFEKPNKFNGLESSEGAPDLAPGGPLPPGPQTQFERPSTVETPHSPRELPDEPNGLPDGNTGISNRMQEDLVIKGYLQSAPGGKGMTNQEFSKLITQKGTLIDAGAMDADAIAEHVKAGGSVNEDDIAALIAQNTRYTESTSKARGILERARESGDETRITQAEAAYEASIEAHQEFVDKVQHTKTRASNIFRMFGQMIPENTDSVAGIMAKAKRKGILVDEDLVEKLKEKAGEVERLKGLLDTVDESHMPTYRLEGANRGAVALEQEFLTHPEYFDPSSPTYDRDLHMAMYKHMEGHAPGYDAAGKYDPHSDGDLETKAHFDKWNDELNVKHRQGGLNRDVLESMKETRDWVKDQIANPNQTRTMVPLRRKPNGKGYMGVFGDTSNHKFINVTNAPEDVKLAIRHYVEGRGDLSELRYVTRDSYQRWVDAGKPDRMPGFNPKRPSEISTDEGIEGSGYGTGAYDRNFYPLTMVKRLAKELDGRIDKLDSGKMTHDIRYTPNDLANAKLHYNGGPELAREAQAALNEMRAAVVKNPQTRIEIPNEKIRNPRDSIDRSATVKAERQLAIDEFKRIWAASKPPNVIRSDPLLLGYTVEQVDRLRQVAPVVIRIVKSYAKEGFDALGDIIAKFHEDTGQKLEEKDVQLILSGRLNQAAEGERIKTNYQKLTDSARESIKADVIRYRRELAELDAEINTGKAESVRSAKRIAELEADIKARQDLLNRGELAAAKKITTPKSEVEKVLLKKRADLEKEIAAKADELGTLRQLTPGEQIKAGLRTTSQAVQERAVVARKLKAVEKEAEDLEKNARFEKRKEIWGPVKAAVTEDRKSYRKWWADSVPGQREGMYQAMNRLQMQKEGAIFSGQRPRGRVTPELAPENLSQKLQLERARIERDDVYRQLEKKAEDQAKTPAQHFLDHVVGTLALPRKFATSIDTSLIFNHNAWSIFSDPAGWAKANGALLRAAKSPWNEVQELAKMKLHKDYTAAVASGLKLDPHEIFKTERFLPNKVLDAPLAVGKGKLQVGLNPFAMSERSWGMGLAKNRLEMFSRLKDTMEGKLFGNKKLTLEQLKDLSEYVQIATGRGVGKLGDVGGLSGNVFFAGRFWASRLQLGSGWPLIRAAVRKNPKLAVVILRDYMTATGAILGAATLYNKYRPANSTAASLSPSDPNFLQATVGDRKVDLSMGTAQSIKLIAKIYERKSLDPITQTASGKLAPIPRTSLSVRKGSAYGKSYDLSTKEGKINTARSLGAPITGNEIYDILNDEHLSVNQKAAFVLSALAGVQSHESN